MSEDVKPKLTDKQRVFIEEYLRCWNATEAARLAGYAGSDETLRAVGSENLTKPNIAREISARVKDRAMCADEVLDRLTEIARGSLDPFLIDVDEDVWPDLTTEKARQKRHLLKKIKPKRRSWGKDEDAVTETEVELEIHDPVRALKLLGDAHGLFSDDAKIMAAVEAERNTMLEKLKKHLDANDYAKAVEALSKPE